MTASCKSFEVQPVFLTFNLKKKNDKFHSVPTIYLRSVFLHNIL